MTVSESIYKFEYGEKGLKISGPEDVDLRVIDDSVKGKIREARNKTLNAFSKKSKFETIVAAIPTNVQNAPNDSGQIKTYRYSVNKFFNKSMNKAAEKAGILNGNKAGSKAVFDRLADQSAEGIQFGGFNVLDRMDVLRTIATSNQMISLFKEFENIVKDLGLNSEVATREKAFKEFSNAIKDGIIDENTLGSIRTGLLKIRIAESITNLVRYEPTKEIEPKNINYYNQSFQDKVNDHNKILKQDIRPELKARLLNGLLLIN